MSRNRMHLRDWWVSPGFHELPLVLFTGFVVAGSGIGLAHLIFGFLGWVGWLPGREVMALMGVLMGAGLLFSMGHLGRPFRGPLALLRIGRSPLSNEVLVVVVAVSASLLSVALPAGNPLVGPLSLIALGSAAATLLALGFVYRLPGHLTWRGFAVAHPFVLGGAFGLTVLLGRLPAGTQARGELLVLAFLLMDGVLVWDRTRNLNRALPEGVPAHPRFMQQRVSFSVLRTLLGVLFPAVVLLNGWWGMAVAGLFLNLFLDRFIFYSLAVRGTTEGEIKRAEAALRVDAGLLLEDSPSSSATFPADGR